MTIGKCKHGEFELSDGCSQCVADRMGVEGNTPESIAEAVKDSNRNIVKVQYYSQTKGDIIGDREYTYFSVDLLKAGDIVALPVGADNRTTKARVSAIDIPPAEIIAFADKVKTIPTKSILSLPTVSPEQKEMEAGLNSEGLTLKDTDPNAWRTGEEEQRQEPETAVALRPGEDVEAQGYYREALCLWGYANERVIATADDEKLANDDLITIGKLRKAMDDKRVSLVKPKQDIVKAIQETYNILMKPVLEADRINRAKMTAFKMDQRRKVEEAEAVNRQAIEVAKKQATLNNGEFTTDIKPVEVTVAPKLTRTSQGTSGLVDDWKYRIVDFEKLSKVYMIPNDAMLKSIAKQNHDKQVIPGVEFYNEPHLRASAR